MELILIYVFTYLFFCLWATNVANKKGRSGFGFFLLSLVFSPLIGIIAAYIVKPYDLPPIKKADYSRWEKESAKTTENSYQNQRESNINKVAKEESKNSDTTENTFENSPYYNEFKNSSNLADSSAEKLKALNKLKEDGLITEEEYKKKRESLLENMF